MKHRTNLTILAILFAITLSLFPAMLVMADTSLDITITATGSEINITDNQSAWAIGTVQASETHWTGTACTWDNVTNSGSEAVDISIHGHDMAGVGPVNWLLQTANGAGAFAMKAGKFGAAYPYFTIEVNESADAPYELLNDELASGTSQLFGLAFYAPSSGIGNVLMTMAGAGITLTGSID